MAGSTLSVPALAAVAVASMAVIWVGGSLLESASEGLADHYGLSPVLRGTMITAFGSSSPELVSVVVSTLRYDAFALGVGAIVGSAVFDVLVIPALSGLYAEEPLETNRTLVHKETQFYLLAVAGLVIAFALAAIYFPIEGLRGEMTPGIALALLALYGLYLFLQYEDVSDDQGESGAADAGPDDADASSGAESDLRRLWLGLAAGAVLIVVSVEGIVMAADGFGAALGTPEFLWGVTVVAAATSLPDAVISVKAARSGEGVTSVANVLGSNTFDLLVAIPVGVLLAGGAEINFAATVPLLCALMVATVGLLTALRTGLELSDPESVGLLLAYGAFLTWMIAEALGLLAVVPR